MPKILIHSFLALVMVISGSFLGVSTIHAETINVQEIHFTPESKNVILPQDGGASLAYYFVPENPTNRGVIWTSSNPAVAEVNNGVITAKSPGSASIIIVSQDGGKSDVAQVTVQSKVVPVTGVELSSESLNMNVGATSKLIATVHPSNATNKQVSWSSSNSNVVQVNAQGDLIAVGAGRATVHVTTHDGGKSDTAEVIVQAAVVPVTGVELNSEALNMTVGATSKLNATVHPSNATNKQVNWSSSNTNVVQVTPDGELKAVGLGRATVVVITQDGGKADSADITVSGVEVTGISLNKSSFTLYTNGASERLVATVRPSNASNKTVQWSSSNPSVATVNASGTVTPVSSGTATITARTYNGNYADTATVTVRKTSGSVKNFEVVQQSNSNVKITWSGTTGFVLVEIKRSNGSIVSQKETNSRSISFSGLDTDTKYEVYIQGEYMDTFTLKDRKDHKVRNVEVEKTSSSSVEITWSGTKGSVEVELRKARNDSYVASKETSSEKVKFNNLSSDTEYKVYIDDEYVDRFTLDDIRNFKVLSKTSDSVELSWSGTSGTVKVSIRKHDSSKDVDSERTDNKKIKFTGLSSDTKYDVYINSTLAGSFTTEASKGTERNVIVTKSSSMQRIQVSWSGTKGSIPVVLKRNNQTYSAKSTSSQSVSFDGVPLHQEFAIYVNDKYIQSVSLTFRDVEGHWAQNPIDRMVQHNVITGYADGTFRPDHTVTREQFIKLLVQAKRYPLVYGYTSFRDVAINHWSEPYISTAISYGIVDPRSFGQYFNPGGAISREEMAVYLAKALQLPPDASALTFSDNGQIQAKNKGLVGAAVRAGLINGYPDNTFKPKGFLTRAQAAQVISQMYTP